jgi:hypothetical protein
MTNKEVSMKGARFARTLAAAFVLSFLAAPTIVAWAEPVQKTASTATARESAALQFAENQARQGGLGKIQAGSTGRTIAKSGWVIFVLVVFTIAAILIA